MREQTSPNPTHARGHHDTNKVEGEGPAVTSQAPATSGGGEGRTARDSAAPGDEAADAATGAPSMRTPVADPGAGGPAVNPDDIGGDRRGGGRH